MLCIERQLLEKPEVIQACQELAPRTVILVDACLEKSVGASLYQRFGKNIDLLAIPAGERCKTRAMKARIEDTLLDWGCLRDTCLLVIGGGTLLDLVGFVAATYCRGIPYVSCPSTLLAMTDAAIGGKTGINLPQGKNLLGAFYPPEHIFCDLALLDTLPSREWVWGLSETIKHALIASRPLFALLECEWERILARDPATVGPMIEASMEVKRAIVQRDPRDRLGERALLNFGHTVGHALEASSRYGLSHGEAVSVGMRVEAALAHRLGDLDIEEYSRIEQLLRRLPLPRELPLDPGTLRYDKKGGAFVSLCAIGRAQVRPLTLRDLKGAWDATMRCHQAA